QTHGVVVAAPLYVAARRARTQHALDDGDDGGVGRLFLELSGGHGLLQHGPRRELPVTDVREQLVGLLRAVFRGELRELLAFEQRLRIQRSEEHTSELQSHLNLVCRLLLEKKKLQCWIYTCV